MSSLNEIQKGYEKAGYKKVQETINNVVFEVPKADGSGTFYSRLERGTQGGEFKGDRVINTENNGNLANKQYVNPDGSDIKGLTKEQRKAVGHIHLNNK